MMLAQSAFSAARYQALSASFASAWRAQNSRSCFMLITCIVAPSTLCSHNANCSSSLVTGSSTNRPVDLKRAGVRLIGAQQPEGAAQVAGAGGGTGERQPALVDGVGLVGVD